MMRSVLLASMIACSCAALSCRSGDAQVQARSEARPGAGSSDAGAGPPVVRVDPSLVSSGRIVIGPAQRRPLRGDLRLPAEVVPSESASAEVGTLVSGRVGSIEVREGEAVTRGQIMAYVESPEAARVVAEVIRARARAIAAARKLDRQLALEQDRATSPAAVDEVRTELATAEADAAAARTLLSSLGLPEPPPPAQGALAARVPVRSPIDGVVVSRALPLGAPISPDKTLFRVLAADRVFAEARWTDATLPPPADGTAVKLLARGSGDTACTGRVLATIAAVDEKTRARRVRVAPDRPCPMLVPGAYVDVSLTSAALGTGAASALAVPKEAVVDVRGAPTVFVAGREKGSFAAHVVRTGRTTTEDIAIDEGLAEGDLVVVVGAVMLKGELLRSELESQ
ncbi:MAG: putative Co/Zn/Cd efflux system rane fusion protein [Labilithrix sp.]|nr:putative Co/Zn/Cd efflux system rane fusion protein [Labilithrix sp.]